MKARGLRAPRASGPRLALVAAGAMFVGACGGASTPAPVSAAGATGGEPTAASAQKVTTVGGVELVAGARRLKVAGPETAESLAPSVLFRPGRAVGAERSQMDSEPFRVSDVPSAVIPEALSAASAPKTAPSGDEAAELFVDWQSAVRGNSIIPRPESYTSVRVSIRGQKLARIRIGGSEGTVVGGAGGGVYVVCRVPEDAPRRYVSARWESLSPSVTPPSGSAAAPRGAAEAGGKAARLGPVTLTVTDAWFDMHECKATIVRRTSVDVKPLVDGLLFGYREPCAKCAAGSQTEVITLLGPMPQTISASGLGGEATTVLGAVTRVSLPVRKGGGGSLMARYSVGIVRDWFGSLGKVGTTDNDVVVGVDITQGVGDPEPVAIAYTSYEAGTASAPPPAQEPDLSMSVFGMRGSESGRFSPPIKAGRPTIKIPKPAGSPALVDPFAPRILKLAPQERLGF